MVAQNRWITRQALLDSKADFNVPVTPKTKALFVDYLWQTYKYGQMDIKRNFGYAVNPDEATLLVYFDAGHEGIMYILHLMYKTKTPGVFHSISFCKPLPGTLWQECSTLGIRWGIQSFKTNRTSDHLVWVFHQDQSTIG